jgi:hypothetical protein
MTSLSRNRTLRIFHSPIALRGALLAITFSAATALTVSSQEPSSLADLFSVICSQHFQSASPTEASFLAENVTAIVNAIGPIRQVVRGEEKIPRRYLVIVPGAADNHGIPVQVEME